MCRFFKFKPRNFSFAFQGIPQSFAFVLFLFLLGIALGVSVGKFICKRYTNLYAVSGILLITAGITDFVFPHLPALASEMISRFFILIPAIFLCAFFKGIIFPIAHHLGTSTNSGTLGQSVSKVYFFNIVGSTLGPLVTGFVLLNILPLHHVMALMSALTFFLGYFCLGKEKPLSMRDLAPLGILALLLFIFPVNQQWIIALAYRYPHIQNNVNHIIENRSGIIHTLKIDGVPFNAVFGGNIYDGMTNINLKTNINGLERAIVLSLLKQNPKHILVIGMSTGAWVRVLSSIPSVERIDVIEINGGYINLIRNYPAIEPILNDPKIHIYIDDGRKWLNHYTGKPYDLVVMNTSYHWRAYATNILSAEFLQLVNQHLAPRGIMGYNSTDSALVLQTAESVFSSAYVYNNFVIASDHDFRSKLTPDLDAAAIVYGLELDGVPLLTAGESESDQFLYQLFFTPFMNSSQYSELLDQEINPDEIITDWNMLTEYKYGYSLSKILVHGMIGP